MKAKRTYLVGLALVAAAFAVAAAFYNQLPAQVPTHWNLAGKPDGFTPKPWGAFMGPLVMAGVYLLLAATPFISPRGYRMERFRRAFSIVFISVLTFLLVVTIVGTLAAAGEPVPIGRVVVVATGGLFIVLGNFMGKLTKNFFIGIRTPWTLASDEVWLRTHRLAGKLFVLGGAALAAAGLLGDGRVTWVALVVVVVLAVGVPLVYSYVVYRRLEGLPPGGDDTDDGSAGS